MRCEAVRALSSDHKKLLFRLLSNGWSITDTPPDTSRIRALEKVASDARRLRGALNSLEAKDAASLDSNYRQTIPLSTRLLALEELEHDAAALAKVIKGEQADISRLRQKRTAAQLVKTLCMFGIPCGTRNDHDVDVRNVTTAMRCVMFSMLEAGSKNLSWSTTASIIKLGIRVQTDPSENRVLPLEGLQAVTQAGEDALRLFMLEEPLWNGIRLET
ncbi:TPA: hypothetical protein L6A85_25430 [Pseudomonas aeruginosa]|nr:hypothetical protein [Pseudomonas aeruginosa]